MTIHKKNLINLPKEGDCLQCGTCSAICPTDAISFVRHRTLDYSPKINTEKCIGCHLCERVCPSLELSWLSNALITDMARKRHIFVGHSGDPFIRYNATSGGIVTSLIKFLLENKLVDGVITTKFNLETFTAKGVIVTEKNLKFLISELMAAKYVPAFTIMPLKKILNDKKSNKKYAFVGLPCQILGLKKVLQIRKDFKPKFFITIGLFCGGAPRYAGSSFLLTKKLSIDIKDIRELKYRGNGWPGYLTIKTKSGMSYKFRYPNYWNNVWDFFLQKPCYKCTDIFNSNADISVGDAWGLDKINTPGASVIICRTRRGLNILREAEKKNYIKIKRQITESELIISQRNALSFKVRSSPHRLKQFSRILKNFNPYLVSLIIGKKSKTISLKNIILYIKYSVFQFIAARYILWPLLSILNKIARFLKVK